MEVNLVTPVYIYSHQNSDCLKIKIVNVNNTIV